MSPLLTQSEHSVVTIVATQNDGRTPFRRLPIEAAEYIDRILRGAKAVDLPVQLPTKFKLVVNLKAAKAIGIQVPPSLVARADRVIE